MEEACDTLIVGHVSPRALLVAESNGSPPDGMPVVAAQSRKIERVNQVAERHVSLFSKLTGALFDDFSPLRETALGISPWNQNASACQQTTHVCRNEMQARVPPHARRETIASSRGPSQNGFRAPVAGSRTQATVPCKLKFCQQIPMRFEFCRHLPRRQHRTLRIEEQLLGRQVQPPAL